MSVLYIVLPLALLVVGVAVAASCGRHATDSSMISTPRPYGCCTTTPSANPDLFPVR
jgi:hypothetical protein